MFSPRRQPLKVAPDVKLIAVTRIESQKTTGSPVALSEAQKEKLVNLVLRTLDLKKTFLKNGNDFRESLCRRSYGISVDEPVAMNFERRQYIFNVRAKLRLVRFARR